MLWLLFVVCFIALLSFADLEKRDNLSKKVVILSFLLMAITAGFRNVGGIDTDYQIYMDHYNGEYGTYFIGWWEPGYCFCVWLANAIGLSYNWFIVALTSLSLFFLVRLILKKSTLPMFSIMLYLATYYLFYNMVLLRQMVSVVCFVYCIFYIIEDKKGKLLLSFFLGFMFHYSIIVLLPAYFVLKYARVNLVSIIIFITIGLLFRLIGIEKILIFFLNKGGNFLVDRTINYIGNNSFSLNIMEYVKMAIVLLLIVFRYNSINKGFKEQILLKSYLLFCVTIIAFGNIEIFFRMAMYFDLATLFLLPFIFNELHFTASSKILCYSFISVFVIFSYMYRMINFGDGEFYSYKFFFLQ